MSAYILLYKYSVTTQYVLVRIPKEFSDTAYYYKYHVLLSMLIADTMLAILLKKRNIVYLLEFNDQWDPRNRHVQFSAICTKKVLRQIV